MTLLNGRARRAFLPTAAPGCAALLHFAPGCAALLHFALGCSALLHAAPATAATVDIKVENVAGKGKVSVAVCDRERYLKQCAYTASVPAEAGTTKVTVPDVPPGTFAVLAYEDANDNGELDRVLGIPNESWGMSRDPAVMFGPPKFEDAAIEVKENPTVVDIKLR